MRRSQRPAALQPCTHLHPARSPAPSSRNKLSGTLPPGLTAKWAAMDNLQLSSNGFTGTIPREWANMRRLRVLFLQ